eukprot:scaffold76682_cov82-Cyclotella_meneghiniana.AAC.1
MMPSSSFQSSRSMISRRYQKRHRTIAATTSHFASRYEIGDRVLIDDWHDDDNTSYKSGTIEEVRGGGWYTIRLKEDDIRVKRRANQLQTKEEDIDDGSNNANNEVRVSAALPHVDILDLDFILRQKSTLTNNNNSRNDDDDASTTIPFTIDNETLEQLHSCHTKCKRWIVFSDLHVMPSTLTTCLQVLDIVHTTAIQKEAGILFLGDFWHHRGYVRVDCLNAILHSMSQWTVPCIMIPGNHDQMNWDGTVHALTPLSNAYRIHGWNYNLNRNHNTTSNDDENGTERMMKMYPGPLILSHPTKFMNALFVPHTRDKLTMKSILASKETTESRALFVHADVKGASMNDLIKSQHGISADIFPSGKLVYSGHFHKPHTVSVSVNGESAIRYVGSPYQTSLSESGQCKYLLLVDAQDDWKCVEEIPIDVGSRYHRVTSLTSFLRTEMKNLRSGDKISFIVPQRDLEYARIGNDEGSNNAVLLNDKINALREEGVSVEIRNVQTEPAENSIQSNQTDDKEWMELEDLSPKATLEAYIKNEVDTGAIKDTNFSTKLLKDGGAILDELGNDSSHSDASRAKKPVTMELDSVSITGFGSFRKEVNYPLSNRGVVLLRGTNKDFGSDSNGVGKSTLAMASLWALVGTLDARPVQDGKVADVVNDSCKLATVSVNRYSWCILSFKMQQYPTLDIFPPKVILRGSLNSKPFVVKRTKNMTSGSSLSFTLDGSDLTLQSPSDTQKLINSYFASDPQVLTRAIFHGQHSIGSLLESSDAKLKDELSTLISLDVWQTSASLVRSKHRELQKKVSELDGMYQIRKNDAAKAKEKCELAKDEMNRRKAAIEDKHKSSFERKKTLLGLDSRDLDESIRALQTNLTLINDEIVSMEHTLYNSTSTDNERLAGIRSSLDKALHAQARTENDLQYSTNLLDAKKAELSKLENQLVALRSEWNFNDSNQMIAAARSVCKACGQPITSEETVEYLRQSTASKIEALKAQITCINQEVESAELTILKVNEEAATISKEVDEQQNAILKEETSISSRSQELRNKLKDTRYLHRQLSLEYSRLVDESQEALRAKMAQLNGEAEMQRMNDALSAAVHSYDVCFSDYESVEQHIAEIKSEKESTSTQASSYGSLIDVFGSKGIQTFVLRNLVKALQYCSQSYLDELSDGSLKLVFEVGQNDNIIKQAKTINGDGTWRTRSLSSLSGGQWRRCSLSLSLGFVDLASHRGAMRSSLLVLDEPLTHLDSSGRDSVGKLLRKMLSGNNNHGTFRRQLGGLALSTILVILQDIAAEEIEECFDYIDQVVKSNGESYVVLDQSTID